MCGIAGFLAKWGEARPDARVVQRFAAAMIHRGPDGGGFFFDGPAALAHRRLSIIDLSPAGLQPMTNEDGQVAIAVNGEIYNHQELRSDLEKKGHHFRSHSDSEVVAHLYEEVGDRVPELLRGMFALAIYDVKARRLLLARDRFGEKPLYYTQRPDGFAFASELAALLADPGTDADVSPAAVDLYLSLQYVPAPDSIFRQVKKLPAGCLLEVACGGEPRVRRYYQINYQRALHALDEREAAERVRAAVEDAVRVRLMSDVPLGAFLSGGLDSSIVVACMARATSRPVQTFSVGFVGAEVDELPFARIIAQRFGTDHHELVVDPDMTSLLPSIVRHHGEPFADSSALPTRILCEMTRRQVTVALSGDGGDEAFGGYRRYRWGDLAARLSSSPLAFLACKALQATPGARAHAIRRFGRRLADDDAARYLSLICHFSREEQKALYGPRLRETLVSDAAHALFSQHLQASAAQDNVSRYCDLDAHTYLPDDIFTKVDIASMTFGLEARAPFVDHLVMELGAALPGRLKLHRGKGKYILKQAFADLVPPAIRSRRKKGFASPTRGWFAGRLRQFARDLLLSPEARQRGLFDISEVERLLARHAAGEDHGERIWNLVVLEQWHRELVDGRAHFQSEVAATAERLAREAGATAGRPYTEGAG
jgi:asparagine synthase (glutamine-hydrolysing)